MNIEHIATRLETLAQCHNGIEHRNLRRVLRELVRELMAAAPSITPPQVEFAGILPRIVEHLNECGPKRVADIRCVLPDMSPSAITAAIKRGVDDGKLKATDSVYQNKPCRVYSTPEWDIAHSRMKCDIAASWMRNQVQGIE